jgi:hypothetical protein
MGHAMREIPVDPGAAAAGPNQIDLPLAGLPAGDYLIEITARAAAGAVKERVAFRVTS